MPIDCGDPGVENLLLLSVHKISKPSDVWVLRPALVVMSYGRIPPNLFSDANTYVVVGQGSSPRDAKPNDGTLRVWGDGLCPRTDLTLNMRRAYGVRKILPEYGSSTGVPGGKPRTWM